MERAFERRPWLLPLVLALLTLVFMRAVIFPQGPGYALDGADFQAEFYPLNQYMLQTIDSGELPLWNPHQFIGHPIAGNSQAALFYPATWFIWLVGVVRGIGLSLTFHIWLAAWGMAALTRRFKASYVGSLLAGVIYAMSGWAAWRSALIGAAVLGISILGGHPPLVLYGGLLLATLWLFHVVQADDPLRAGWYAGRLLAIIVIGGLILGAALLLPAAELSGLSSRNSADLTFANSFALPPAQFIGLALPTLFGNPKVPPYYYWGADFFQEFMAYAGLLPLLAIPLIFRWPRREHWYFLGLVALGLVMSVGLAGGLMPVLWRWVPGFTSFRTPGRSLYFVMVGVAGLTALLVTALQRSTAETRRAALRPALSRFLPAAVVIAFSGALVFLGWYLNGSQGATPPARALVVSGNLASAGAILLGVWLVLWLWTKASDTNPKLAHLALALTCVLVIADAWHVSDSIIGVSQLHQNAIWAGAQANVPVGADARVVAPLGFENLASVTGHLNVAGYDPLPVDSLDKFEAMSNPSDPSTPMNTLLGVKYLFATRPYRNRNFALIGGTHWGTHWSLYYRRKYPFPREFRLDWRDTLGHALEFVLSPQISIPTGLDSRDSHSGAQRRYSPPG